ncbi:carbohydrate binding domain-containing protein [Stenotrophomonas sp. Ste96]|uniref:carbohydrate binding domain-containing protein n=1 Tax=Stenotrophomonas sp. Ste96 TaxID=2926029 RepID=UPI0021C59C53|nr:carbohydrate binding domain-containing protein [Stenotrophomonas sp. Ste96]
MQERKITLIDIGAGALPSVTPVTAQNSSWFPTVYVSAETPPVDGVTPEPVADGVLIEWDAVDQAGVVYIIERGPSQNGPWTEIHRTTETRYLYSDGSGQKWFFRITASVRGKPGQGTVVEATPAPTTAELVAAQQKLDKEIVDRVLADANEAASRARDIGLVNAGLVQEAQTRVTQIGQAMDAVAAESRTRATQLLNEKMEREAAITAVSETQQNGFDSLSRALSEVAAGSGTQFDSKRIWDFNLTVESWTGNGAPVLVDGWLRPANAAANPYVQSPGGLGIDGSAYRYVKIRIKKVGKPSWAGALQWVTTTDATWNAAKRVVMTEPAWDGNGVATMDAADVPWWPATVAAIRLQLGAAQTLTDYYVIDWVAIGRPSPGASMALVQEQAQAQTTALAAEASKRDDLAVQMRGSYTGSDLSKVTQGLMADERTARATADSAQLQRITTMEARMPAGSGGLATSASVTTLQDAMVAADQANAQATTKVSSDLRAAMSRGVNLVNNGDIGNDLAGWQISGGQPGAWSVSATEGRGGGRCLKGVSMPVGVVASAQANLNEGIEVKVGRRYRLRAWVKVSADYVGDTDNSKIRVGAIRTDGTEVLLWSRTYNSGWTNWTLVEAVFTIAEGTARFRLSAGIRNTAGYVLVDDFELVDVTDEEQIAATASGLSSLTTRTGIIEGTQNAQATLIGQVQSGLTQTNGNVTAAQQAAQAAADAAGAKGKVIYGAALPAANDRLPQNLWIDSTGNSNTPKRWNGTAWAAVSDKVATDAAAAAAAAQQTANAAQSQASANAGALSTLDTKVTQQGAALTSLGQAITTVNAELDGLRTLGDNLIPNSNFSAGLQWWSLQAPFPVWSETAGDSRPGVTMTRTTSSNPALGAMDAQWIPNRGARRYRAIVRAMGVSGAMNLMVRLQRQNRETLAVGYSDKQLTLASSFATYAVDFDAVDATIGAVRLWVYNYPNNAVVRVDSVELYDITDQLAAEANAAATSTLSGKVTSLEGTTTAQGEAITSVNAAIAATQAAGPNIVIDAGFEGFASEQIIHTLAAAGEFRAKAGNAGSSCFEGTRVGLLRRTVAPSTGNTDAYFGPSISVVTGRTYFIEAVVRNNSFFSGVAPGAAVFRFGLSVLTSGNARAWHAGVENRRLDALSQWTRVSAYVTVTTPNARSAQLWVSIPGSMPTGGLTDQNVGVLVDNVIWQDVTDAYGAKTTADAAATGLSALTTTVTQQGGQITALGQQVNQVGASVAGKADTQVVQTLTAMVKDTMTGGGNLLSNTLFKDGRRGWGWWNSGNGTWHELGLVAGPEWAPPGLVHFGGFAPSNLALNTQFWAGDEQPVPVVAGKRYCFSAYINCHRVGLALLISFRDANGNTVGEQYSGPADATNITPPITLERLKRLTVAMVAPAGAVSARVGYYLRGLGLSNNEGNYFWIFQPMLEEMREGQTGPSPYSAGGGETLAGYSLYVTADGLTGGMVTKNDGKVVDMKILANVLQILSPNQPEGIEMRDGYIRVWKGNSQRIIGTGFGSGDLMDYFGPNVGAGAANKMNATMWMDVSGNAYWGGSLSAGIWKNANRTSSTAANPYVEVGPFAAHGKQRVVVASFSTFSPTYTTWYDGRSSSNEPPPPAIASSTVLRLRRNVGAGLELVSQQAFPASAVLVNLTYHDRDAGIRELPNGGWQQEYYFACSGSFTATEPGSTFQNFIYEGAITTQAIPQIVSQTIAVVSTEEP